ncbi:hypothetical protein J6590_045909 [Homalodisca vitripennis]|nr:hypothetical protein J6590_045909 [Homalodisca vitripennis]
MLWNAAQEAVSCRTALIKTDTCQSGIIRRTCSRYAHTSRPQNTCRVLHFHFQTGPGISRYVVVGVKVCSRGPLRHVNSARL